MLWTIFSILYALVATFSIYMTWREHVVKGRKSLVWTGLGMIACLVWPLLIAAVSLSLGRKAA